jgi:hypothetical protein
VATRDHDCTGALDTDHDPSGGAASGWRRVGETAELGAVLELMDGGAAADFDRAALVGWLDRHVVTADRARPLFVTEPGAGRVALQGPDFDPARLKGIVGAACARVSDHLRGLLGPRRDDRFVAGAIFAGRVRRVTIEKRRAWTASPSSSDSLGDILVALLAVDVLTRRDFYDAPWSMAEDDAGALTNADRASTSRAS